MLSKERIKSAIQLTAVMTDKAMDGARRTGHPGRD